MERFCEYCGKQIDDGECDCPQAVAAREREELTNKAKAVLGEDHENDPKEDLSGNAVEFKPEDKPSENIEDAGASGVKSKVEEMLGSTGAEVALDLKDLFIGMFTKPVETLEENARRKDHASSYIVAAVLSVLVFIILAIMGDTSLVNLAIGRGTLVIFSLSAAIAVFVLKAIYAGCITLWGKKYNPGLTYSSALGTFCLLGIYDLVILLAITIFTVLGIYELSIAGLFFWLIVTAVSAIVASRILTEGKAESVIFINLILLFIFIFMIVLSLRGIVMEMCAGAITVFMESLAG